MPFVCDYCDLSFMNKVHFVSHRKHGDCPENIKKMKILQEANRKKQITRRLVQSDACSDCVDQMVDLHMRERNLNVPLLFRKKYPKGNVFYFAINDSCLKNNQLMFGLSNDLEKLNTNWKAKTMVVYYRECGSTRLALKIKDKVRQELTIFVVSHNLLNNRNIRLFIKTVNDIIDDMTVSIGTGYSEEILVAGLTSKKLKTINNIVLGHELEEISEDDEEEEEEIEDDEEEEEIINKNFEHSEDDEEEEELTHDTYSTKMEAIIIRAKRLEQEYERLNRDGIVLRSLALKKGLINVSEPEIAINRHE